MRSMNGEMWSYIKKQKITAYQALDVDTTHGR